MKKEYRTIINDVALPYKWALGRTWTRFFDGLKEEKILGTKCLQCGKTFVPARSFCPDCFVSEMEWVEAAQEGAIVTWTLVDAEYDGQTRKPPYVIALVKLAGTDCCINHYVGGIDLSDLKKVRQKLKEGAKVKAVWSPDKKADIHDIAYFAPVR